MKNIFRDFNKQQGATMNVGNKQKSNSKHSLYAVVLLASAILMAVPVTAQNVKQKGMVDKHGQPRQAIAFRSEEDFLKQYGRRAKTLAKGVYSLNLGGQSMRFSFGPDGLNYERDRIVQEIARIDQANRQENAEWRAILVEDLEALREQQESVSKVLSNSNSNTQVGASYSPYGKIVSIDAFASGDFAYASSYATATIEPDGFGPESPATGLLRVTSKAFSVPTGFRYGPKRTLYTGFGTISTGSPEVGPDFCTYAQSTSQVTVYLDTLPALTYYVSAEWDPCDLANNVLCTGCQVK